MAGQLHREEFAWVAHVDATSALIAWGAFFLEEKGQTEDRDQIRFKLVDDSDLEDKTGRKHGSLGWNTDSYGAAQVRVRKQGDPQWQPWQKADGKTCARVRGLEPDTRYFYEVQVDGKVWAERPRIIAMDKLSDERRSHNEGICTVAGRAYEYHFTTFSAENTTPDKFTFAVIGDAGTRRPEQGQVGQALANCIEEQQVRFVLTLGDNIYMLRGKSKIWKGIQILLGKTKESGDEDDDWFASYFLPYRDVINRVPVFPCLGNHDSDETEEDDDLAQLIDNFHLAKRFPEFYPDWHVTNSKTDKLFYRFKYGENAEFIALDTSFSARDGIDGAALNAIQRNGNPPLSSPEQKAFLDEILAEKAPPWRIVFSHHPPFTAGPNHKDNDVVHAVARRFAGASPHPCIWMSGHEHNFQHHQEHNIHYFVSGAAGKSDAVKLKQDGHPKLCCYSSVSHFLLVTIEGNRMTVRVMGANGAVAPLTQGGNPFPPHAQSVIQVDA